MMKCFLGLLSLSALTFMTPALADLQDLYELKTWSVTCEDSKGEPLTFERKGEQISSNLWEGKHYTILETKASLGISWAHSMVETKEGKRGVNYRLAFNGNQATFTAFSVVRDAISNSVDRHLSHCSRF